MLNRKSCISDRQGDLNQYFPCLERLHPPSLVGFSLLVVQSPSAAGAMASLQRRGTDGKVDSGKRQGWTHAGIFFLDALLEKAYVHARTGTTVVPDSL